RQRGTAASPDAVAHVSVSAVRNAGFAQVADVVQVLFDLLVAAREIEGDLRHVVKAAARPRTAADVVDLEAAGFPFLPQRDEAFGGGVFRSGGEADPSDPQLLEIGHVVVGCRTGAGADLDTRRNGPECGGRWRRGREQGGAAECELRQIAARGLRGSLVR